MYHRHNNITECPTNEIFQTYLLLAVSIGTYLFGTQISISQNLIIFLIFGSIPVLIAVITTESQVFLLIYSFMIGLLYSPFLTYLNIINPSIVSETLQVTIIIFIGLTFIAYKTSNYNTFALYGLLYTCLTTILWLLVFNIFYQNVLVDPALMYVLIIIFSEFIIVDTHNLLKNPSRSPVVHALHLFLDFINLFVNLLEVMKQIKILI